MTLYEFLTARLDEDEGVARTAIDWSGHSAWRLDSHGRIWCSPDGTLSDEGWDDEWATHVARNDPGRVVREVEAKRAIIELDFDSGLHPDLGRMLRHLAAVYADHPDYDEAWRPGSD